MGRRARRRQEKLAGKLKNIRQAMGLSQNELIARLGLSEELTRNRISDFETGAMEPPLFVLIEYSRIAGVSLDVLARDDVPLPKKFGRAHSK